jgi:hypothetical protein
MSELSKSTRTQIISPTHLSSTGWSPAFLLEDWGSNSSEGVYPVLICYVYVLSRTSEIILLSCCKTSVSLFCQ